MICNGVVNQLGTGGGPSCWWFQGDDVIKQWRKARQKLLGIWQKPHVQFQREKWYPNIMVVCIYRFSYKPYIGPEWLHESNKSISWLLGVHKAGKSEIVWWFCHTHDGDVPAIHVWFPEGESSSRMSWTHTPRLRPEMKMWLGIGKKSPCVDLAL